MLFLVYNLVDGTPCQYNVYDGSHQACKLASLDSSPFRDEDSSRIIPEGFSSCDWNLKQTRGKVYVKPQMQPLVLKSPIALIPIDGVARTAHIVFQKVSQEAAIIMSHDERQKIVQ